MSKTMTNFLAELSLAKFEADTAKNEAKIQKMESALRWEKKRQSLRSYLSIMLERSQLTRRENNYVLFGINEATPEELKEKINFVSSRFAEDPNPAKQFKSRERAKKL